MLQVIVVYYKKKFGTVNKKAYEQKLEVAYQEKFAKGLMRGLIDFYGKYGLYGVKKML